VGAAEGPADEDREEQDAADEHADAPGAAAAAAAGPPESRPSEAELCMSGKVAWQAFTRSLTPRRSASSYSTPTSMRSVRISPV
jgi:hypothetical protein